SLDGEIFSGGKKCQESNIGDSDNTKDGGKIVDGAIGACSGGIVLSQSPISDSRNFFSSEEISPPKDVETPVESSIPVSSSSSVDLHHRLGDYAYAFLDGSMAWISKDLKTRVMSTSTHPIIILSDSNIEDDFFLYKYS
nr:hypothetical protein [Tanacetum cinerariifolium]